MDIINIGVDIVDLADLQKKIKRSSLFLGKILNEQEVSGLKIESIAGKIAAKEAIIKTGYIKPGQWKDISILSKNDGAPLVFNKMKSKITNLKISISHSNSAAVAVALYEKN